MSIFNNIIETIKDSYFMVRDVFIQALMMVFRAIPEWFKTFMLVMIIVTSIVFAFLLWRYREAWRERH